MLLSKPYVFDTCAVPIVVLVLIPLVSEAERLGLVIYCKGIQEN